MLFDFKQCQAAVGSRSNGVGERWLGEEVIRRTSAGRFGLTMVDCGRGKDSPMKSCPWDRSVFARVPLMPMLARIERWRLIGTLYLIALSLVVFGGSLTFFCLQGFRLPSDNDHGEKLTILINTWKRPDLLKDSVAHYAACKKVDAIRVVWSESPSPPDELRATLTQKVAARSLANGDGETRLIFDVHEEEQSLNVRMKPLKDVETNAIFSVDDDIIVPCSTLEFAFGVWRGSQDAMVGFAPRMHVVVQSPKETGEKQGPLRYGYGGWWWVWWNGSYSIILTKAALLHHKYFVLYTNEMPQSVRDYVAQHRNCEDIAMSYLVANATSAPPIWVKAHFKDKGSKGISSDKGHLEQRSKCLNAFVDLFGGMPLVVGHSKVVDMRRQLFW